MSLASIKRRVKVGTRLRMTRHDWFPQGSMTVHGNLGTTQLRGANLLNVVRPVVVVHTNEVGLKTEKQIGDELTSSVSYLTWPKASCIRETTNGFQIDLQGTGNFAQVMEYEFVEPGLR